MKTRIFAAGLVTIGLGIALAGWWRFVDRDSWHTMPRQMPVVDADGASVGHLSGAIPSGFDTLRDGDSLWTHPGSVSAHASPGLVRFDLVSRRGVALWPTKPSRFRPTPTAFLPGIQGRFGYIYSESHFSETVVDIADQTTIRMAAIGNDGGWLRAPLEVARDATLVATAWSGDRLEMMFRSRSPDFVVEFVGLSLAGAPARRRLELDRARGLIRRHLDEMGMPSSHHVGLSLRAVHHDGKEWWLSFQDLDYVDTAFAVSETGTVRATRPALTESSVWAPFPGPAWFPGPERVTADGLREEEAKKPVGLDATNAVVGHFHRVADGHIEPHRIYAFDKSASVRMHWVHELESGALVSLMHDYGDEMSVDAGAYPAPDTTVARMPTFLCSFRHTVIELEDQHLLIVDSDGHYFELDGDGKRVDGLGWSDHLRAQPGERAELRPWFFLWVLFGPLAAAAPGMAAVLVRRRQRRVEAQQPKWSPPRLFLWGAGLYVISAGFALRELWPMLR